MNKTQFQEQLLNKGIKISEEQLQKFDLYYKLLIEWNEKMNLTAIIDEGEVYEKHFFDSISPAFSFDFNTIETMCDIGAGAGFPSIPIKILFPHLQLTIVDSLNKRIGFLECLGKTLNLEHVKFIHDRAETFGQNSKYREKFDVVTARAVARLSVLSELCIPLVKKGGVFIALKGNAASEEISVGEKGIFTLGGEISRVESFQLPYELSERKIVFIDKKKNTPKKYPRKAGVPGKSPLEN